MNVALENHSSWRECFAREGVAIIEHLLTPDEVATWIELTQTCVSGSAAGVL
jgi:hypothetical protein